MLRRRGRYVDDAGQPGDARAMRCARRMPMRAFAKSMSPMPRPHSGVLAVLTGGDLRPPRARNPYAGVSRADAATGRRPLSVRKAAAARPGTGCAMSATRSRLSSPTRSTRRERSRADRNRLKKVLPAVVTAAVALTPARQRCGTTTRATKPFSMRSATRRRLTRRSPVPIALCATKSTSTGSPQTRWNCAAASPNTTAKRTVGTIRCTIQSVQGTCAALADRIFKLPQHQIWVVCDMGTRAAASA